MAHNATIIEVLLGLTLLVILFLSIRIFLGAKEPEMVGGASLDLGNLEVTLKKILEKAGQVPASPTTGASEDSQRLVTEISNLKTELETKQKQIEEMKISAASTPAGASGNAASAGLSNEEKSKLEAQIQELQAKLSEYEIISEDIADLSFYKEQNVKLQKELEALKAGGAALTAPAAPPVAAAPAPAAAPVPEPVAPAPPPPPKPEPEIVGKSQATEEVASEPAANTIDDDLMAEFAAAVEKQKTNEAPEAAVAPAVEAPAAPAAEPVVDLGQLDMDKMLAEAATIKSDVPDVDPEKALGTSLDENKLLQEAAALQGVTPEDKKLMGEFENFVKKSE